MITETVALWKLAGEMLHKQADEPLICFGNHNALELGCTTKLNSGGIENETPNG
jgi:hypothetical protein